MQLLPAREAHLDLGATFMALNGAEAVRHYGDAAAEYERLKSSVAVLDFSCRTRLVLVGADRRPFLHSQCTNDINRRGPGEGCYTAFTNNKGRMVGDANVFVLADEILLDAEPGQADDMTERFRRFIVSEDVDVLDATPHYGLLTVQGPRAAEAIGKLELGVEIPDHPFASIKIEHPVAGELYLVNHPRLQIAGADLFVPVGSLAAVLDKLITAATSVGGGLAGWEAFEIARIEAGIPRFGVDMDETNLAPEAGIESRAISYTKGCYIGQEVLNRLHTFAQANKRLCRLRFAPQLPAPPKHGTRLFKEEREAGQVTSSTCVPDGTLVGMGYLRKEWLTAGEEVLLPDGTAVATLGIVE